jgi:hypothetical protein
MSESEYGYDEEFDYSDFEEPEPEPARPLTDSQWVQDYMSRHEQSQADEWAVDRVQELVGDVPDAVSSIGDVEDEGEQPQPDPAEQQRIEAALERWARSDPAGFETATGIAVPPPPTAEQQFRDALAEANARGWQAVAGAQQAQQERLLHEQQRAEAEQQQRYSEAYGEAMDMMQREFERLGVKQVDPAEVLQVADGVLGAEQLAELAELGDDARSYVVENLLASVVRALADKQLGDRVLARAGFPERRQP